MAKKYKPWSCIAYENAILEHCDYDDVWERAREDVVEQGYANEDIVWETCPHNNDTCSHCRGHDCIHYASNFDKNNWEAEVEALNRLLSIIPRGLVDEQLRRHRRMD